MRPTLDLFCIDGFDADGAQRTLLHCVGIMPPGFFKRVALCSPFMPTDPKVEFIRARLQAISLELHERYNAWVINEFPKHIQSDFAMIVHRDGYILRPELWTDEFLKWDYIGAPWPFKHVTGVGNGGFCIRSKRLALLAMNKGYTRHRNANEDMWITGDFRPHYKPLGMEVAPKDLAGKFSCEIPIAGLTDMNHCFGFHGVQQSYVVAHPLRKFL